MTDLPPTGTEQTETVTPMQVSQMEPAMTESHRNLQESSQKSPAENNPITTSTSFTGAKSDSDDSNSDPTDSDDSDVDFDQHQDPSDILVQATTLKEEGNGHFKSGDWSKASKSYRKGTSLLKPLNKNNSGDEQVKALLLSLQNNLSMVCFKQNKTKLSLEVATHALQIDHTNVKALFRRAVAHRKMKNYKQARDDLKQALKYDPSNMAVKKELIAVKREMETETKLEKKKMQKAFKSRGSFLYEDKEREEQEKEEAKKRMEGKEREKREALKVQWENECVRRMANDEAAVSFEDWQKEEEQKQKALEKQKKEEEKRKREQLRQAKKSQTETAENADDSSDDENLTEKELSLLRGYKKTSDGRTTSYFTRELSEAEKQLLGSTAPQRLDESAAPTATPVCMTPLGPATIQSSGKGTASAWNQAGTWEEKDTTEWCKKHLQSKLETATARDDSIVAVVTSVKGLSGEASVAITGGRKRYIFDFHCKLAFEIRDDDDDQVLCSGSLSLPDICSTSHDELEVDVLAWDKAPGDDHAAMATKCRGILVSDVRSSVQEFVADFNAHY